MLNKTNKYSLSKLLRAGKIWWIMLKLICLIWWDSLEWTYLKGYNEHNKNRRQRVRARWVTTKFLNLGSAFIKLGQLLSARPDLLPTEWVNQLSRLQDNVPPFSLEKVKSVIKSELRDKCSEIVEFEENPLGAASLAQVHRAKLKNGREVVLKVQRPGLEKLFRLDLEVMQQVAALIQCNPNWSKGRDFVGIAKESQRVLLRELDFRIEAQYAARFRQQFLSEENIIIPAVIWKLSTQKVLCLDYVEGIKVNDKESLIKNNISPSSIAEIGASSYLQQLVKFGFFHADPHPGNLAVTKDGALIYYDFGMMGVISESLRSRLGSMVKAAAAQDAGRLVEEFQAAGLIASGIEIGPIRRLIRVMLKEALTPPFTPNLIEKISGDLYDLVYGKPFKLPVELIFVMRALSTFEGVGRSLDSSFNLMAIAKPYLIPLMASNDSNGNDLFNEIGRQVSSISSKAVALPKRLDESLERLEQGDLQLQVRMGESDRQLRRMINAQESMSKSILIGCMAIAAALLGTSNNPSYALIPAGLCLPITFSWFKLQLRMKRDLRIDKLPNRKK